MKATFNKIEKLKSKKEIGLLFSEGKSITKYPIKLVYRKTVFEDDIGVKASVSVSKRHFKTAVDRNLIKRLLRESYRKNKYIVPNTTHQFAFMFLFIGNKIPEHKSITTKIQSLLQSFVDKEIE